MLCGPDNFYYRKKTASAFQYIYIEMEMADGDSPLTRWAPYMAATTGNREQHRRKRLGVSRGAAPVSPSRVLKTRERVSPLLCHYVQYTSTPEHMVFCSCYPPLVGRLRQARVESPAGTLGMPLQLPIKGKLETDSLGYSGTWCRNSPTARHKLPCVLYASENPIILTLFINIT